jgi:hypothetical protein
MTNLLRHKKELPPPAKPFEYGASATELFQRGEDPWQRSGDDAFALRLARTPVPRFLSEAVSKHLSRIYSKPIHRKGPADVEAWWKNVDGLGSTIDEWLQEIAAEMFFALGQIDLQFDHPRAPDGVVIKSEADLTQLGLRACVVKPLLPDNLPWWVLDETRPGWYQEVLVREYRYSPEGTCQTLYRHWDAEGSVLYDHQGVPVGGVLPHPFGRVPIRRLFDRKHPTCTNVGLSRYEGISELEREYYNEDSELILSNSSQAHPTLQGPEEAFSANRELVVSPGYALPVPSQPGQTKTEWSYISPPKEAAQFIQTSKRDLLDRIDRQACTTKPAGTAGTGANTVSQSGYSKELDQRDGNDLLTKLARSLRRLEISIAEMANLVLSDGNFSSAEQLNVEITYPGGFNLLTSKELVELGTEVQAYLDNAGTAPQLETALLQAIVRESLPGLDPKRMQQIEDEIANVIESKATAKTEAGEGEPDDEESNTPPEADGGDGMVSPDQGEPVGAAQSAPLTPPDRE